MPHPGQLIVPPSYEGTSRSGSPSGSERNTAPDISRPRTPGGSFGEPDFPTSQAEPVATFQADEGEKGKVEPMTSSHSHYSHNAGQKYDRNDDGGQSQTQGSEPGLLDYLAAMGRGTQAVLTLAVVPTMYVVAKNHSKLNAMEAAEMRRVAEAAAAAEAAGTTGGTELPERSQGPSSTAGNTFVQR